jgi:hypothetical protein
LRPSIELKAAWGVADVVRHTSTFGREPKARNDLAVPGSDRLVLGDQVVSAIRSDCGVMAEEMVFGNASTLDEVLRVPTEIKASIDGGCSASGGLSFPGAT